MQYTADDGGAGVARERETEEGCITRTTGHKKNRKKRTCFSIVESSLILCVCMLLQLL